ncbi:uncharacterized protein [Elaeis guineensis]|uniref:Uncharacterized protein LOC105039084 isoform X2 n=1 Tax=Elaeis guineensis var. tenera TaxID=51953 RepID=A0A6I9QPW6_ELAGV|nr:uncharacterized protein LOC105039084 isoform X2 [Elaeis guineensis]
MGGGRRKSGKNRAHGGRAADGGGTRPLFAGSRSVSARHFAGSSPLLSSTYAIDGSFRGGRGKKNGSGRPQGRGNAFGYAYPTSPEETSGGDDAGRSILLARSGDNPPIVAFVDSSPCEEPGVGVPSYAYDPAVVGGVGLGFRCEEEEEEIVVYNPAKVGRVGLGFRGGEEEEEEVGQVGLGFRGDEEEKEEKEEGEEEEEEERNDEGEEMVGFDSYSTPDVKQEGTGKGFLSIGGVRVYTEDTSSPSEASDGFEDDDTDDGDGDSSEEDGMSDSADESLPDGEEEAHSDGDSLSFDDDSDIDDEVAEDYMEGIGGSSELLSTGWLVSENLESSDDDDGSLKSGNSSDGDNGKLGGIALMNASKEYGMKKPSSRKGKGSSRNWMSGSTVVDGGLSALDDMLFVKDPRMASRKKKSSSHLSQSWPRDARKSKKYKNVPGGKKKHRKELIAMKRRQRMINRGVDLDQINSKLRKMVLDEVDMLSFEPMHSHDCSQVQRLASIYHLWSGRQGSGKKRFVTVNRTGQTCLPSSRDKVRLDKLLGAGLEDDDFVVSHGNKTKPQEQAKGRTKTGRRLTLGPAFYQRTEMHHSAPSKLTKNGEASGKRKGVRKQISSSYAERPVSFISCGIMQVNSMTENMAVDPHGSTKCEKSAKSRSSKLGAFEEHTKGFGSKMMAKMGFVDGAGLGKEGQGMVQPIEVIKRPKSLGLGVQITPDISDVRVKPESLGAFEKHTKGFGSRMMAKMGFVPGTGLGKDAQGIINPLTAVKLPKSRGLGAK